MAARLLFIFLTLIHWVPRFACRTLSYRDNSILSLAQLIALADGRAPLPIPRQATPGIPLRCKWGTTFSWLVGSWWTTLLPEVVLPLLVPSARNSLLVLAGNTGKHCHAFSKNSKGGEPIGLEWLRSL